MIKPLADARLKEAVREWYRVEWSRQDPDEAQRLRKKQGLHPISRAEYRLMEAAGALGIKCTRCEEILESCAAAEGCEDYWCPLQAPNGSGS